MRPVSDTYHGVTIVDNYRWLDDLNDPAVRKWNDEQNAYTRQQIDRFPAWEPLYARLKELLTDTSATYYNLVRRGHLFAMKRQPPKNQSFLVRLESFEDGIREETVVDPNQIDTSGRTSIDWYVPSRDGRLVAVSLSENGSEDGSASVFEVSTGRRFDDRIPGVQYPTAGGDIEWNADNSGFYYTRFPQGDERPPEDAHFYQQVYFHTLGTPTTRDRYVIGREFPRIGEIRLSSPDNGKYLLVTVANGDGGEFSHHLMSPNGVWRQLTQYEDQVRATAFGPDGRLYLLSGKSAPRGSIIALPLTPTGPGKPVPVVSESDWSIEGFLPMKNRIYVTEVLGGPERISVYDLSGRRLDVVPRDTLVSIGAIVGLEGDDILYGTQSYLTPPAYYRYSAATGRSTLTSLAEKPSVDLSDVEVIRAFAPSKDGTKVPISILRRKDCVLDGNNPLILYGYGGYGISQNPSYAGELRLWFDNGGVYAVANLRGGGEFGETWHRQGRLTQKQNVFDDFAACARWLIDTKYTSPSRLAIMGGSNGGLLMGAALTQHPTMFRAVVSYVGIYDMLRVELFPNGEFNTTEFGSVKDPAEFEALYAYSPYHHVVKGAKYPAVLFLTGDNDGRVDPANSRKMTAQLQAVTGSESPILLRTSSNAGHGIGTSLNEYISQEADVYAFLFQQLGMRFTE